ncbi:putative B3 domain-containing protein, partial [Mucuna pruriens]
TLTGDLFLFQQIPSSFTNFFNGITPCKGTLVDHDRKSWDVSLEKIEGRLVFKNGWQQFAREKDLEEGDFLVFQYDGMSTFNVKIFSKTGCRKVVAPASCEKNVPPLNLDEDSDLRRMKIQRGRKRKPSPLSLEINGKLELEGTSPFEGARCKSEVVSEENDNHYEKKPRPTNCVSLQNPHFQITFDAAWKLKKVEVPRRVLRKMNIKLMQKISLRDENDKVWPVTITASRNGRNGQRQFLGAGWSDFQRSNNIQEGNQCDFQFIVDEANVVQELLVRVRSNCPMRWVDQDNE